MIQYLKVNVMKKPTKGSSGFGSLLQNVDFQTIFEG
jgi:hypothetical protein